MLADQRSEVLERLKEELRLLKREMEEEGEGELLTGGPDCRQHAESEYELRSPDDAAGVEIDAPEGSESQRLLARLDDLLGDLLAVQSQYTTTTTSTTPAVPTAGPHASGGSGGSADRTARGGSSSSSSSGGVVGRSGHAADSLPPTRFAYVTAVDDAEAGARDSLWSALALARMLQRTSAYPLLVLTDLQELPGGAGDLREGLRRLNAFPVPFGGNSSSRSLRRLGAWRLTSYEKLVWLDVDAAVTRSLDWIFLRPGLWAQRYDPRCALRQASASMGLLLLYPSEKHYQAMIGYNSSVQASPDDDQRLISTYFYNVVGTDINLLTDVDAAFGRCLGKARTPYLNSDGSPVRGFWSLPAFVHRSGGWRDGEDDEYSNVCFSANITRQVYVVGGRALNVCHFHALGHLWRDHFCQGASALGLSGPEAALPELEAFCEDACWLQGVDTKVSLAAADLCARVNGTPGYTHYYTPTVGWPLPELSSSNGMANAGHVN